jgi:hypothetical protein
MSGRKTYRRVSENSIRVNQFVAIAPLPLAFEGKSISLIIWGAGHTVRHIRPDRRAAMTPDALTNARTIGPPMVLVIRESVHVVSMVQSNPFIVISSLR